MTWTSSSHPAARWSSTRTAWSNAATRDIDYGLAELAAAAVKTDPDLERYADHLLALATPPVGDDIAVVALHRG